MPPSRKRRDTVVWSILLSVAVPALSAAGQAVQTGNTELAAVAGFIGFVATIAFAFSAAYNHPLEQDIADILEENDVRYEDIIDAVEDQTGEDLRNK
jgi:hypothetical protein